MFYAVASRLKKRVNFCLFPFHLFSFAFIVLPFAIVLIKSFESFDNGPISDNFSFVNSLLFTSLLRSLAVAALTLLITFLISYPFAYLVSNLKSHTRRVIAISLVTCPLWSSFFVKLIGLKSFFDLMFGEMNSTRGLIYVVIGLVYINLPIAILTLYNSIRHIPQNIINASLDLGHTRLETVWGIVVPYTHKAIAAVWFLVFLPSISCVSVADFMNKSAGSKLIGQMINDWVSAGGNSGIGVNRLSFVVFILVSLTLSVYYFGKHLVRLGKRSLFYVRT